MIKPLASPASEVPTHAGTGEPLTIIFSFLSRADSTPLDQRRRNPSHILDGNCNPVINPAASPYENAFEAEPNLNFEKWGEYWRKVHGMRFLYVEGQDDHSLDRLLRYDQIHRVPPGPTNLSALPYKAPVDSSGKLFPTVVGHILPYDRPRWDGVAYLNFEHNSDIASVLSSERVVTKIMAEDCVIFRDIAPLLSRQYIVIPDAFGEAGVSLVKTHVRKPDIDRATFQHRWLHSHADDILYKADTKKFVKRYVQLHNIGPVTEGQPFYDPDTSILDGVTLMAFDNMKKLELYLQSEGYEQTLVEEAKFSLLEKSEYWTGLNFGLLNRIQPEIASRR